MQLNDYRGNEETTIPITWNYHIRKIYIIVRCKNCGEYTQQEKYGITYKVINGKHHCEDLILLRF